MVRGPGILKVFFCVPCHANQIYHYTVSGLLGTISEGHKRGIPIGWTFSSGILPQVRNELIADFLNTDATHLFFLDADIAFRPHDVFKLLSLDCDIAVASYPKKQPDRQSTVSKDGEWLDISKYQYPMEIDFSGFGFSCIKRPVIEHLTRESYICRDEGRPVPIICESGMIGDVFCGTEDTTFFRKARKLGYKVTLDPSIKLGHVGMIIY